MQLVSNRQFFGEVVILDDTHFLDCDITDCTLEYSGGDVLLERTNFKGCRFHFGDGAAKVVALLKCFGIVDYTPQDPSPESSVLN